MAILNIRLAKRGESKVILCLAGPSGSGKTFTALKMARGMVEKASQIGLIDAENKRGSLYADILDEPFLIGDLYPPFSPSRYIASLKEFQEAGVKVLVIDSGTHEWEGEGGCDDIANAPKADGTPRKVANWAAAKREHKRFMNTLLQCDMHIIICLRAREKVKIAKDRYGKDEFIDQGMQPVQEKNFMFEMTASILMEDAGKKQTFVKVPSFLLPAFGNGNGYLGESTGRAIMQWIEQGEKEDPQITRYKSELQMCAENGVKAVAALWATIPPALKPALLEHKDLCKASADEYDKQRAEADNDGTDTTISHEDLTTLFELKKDAIPADMFKNAERILSEKEEKSYGKLHKELQAA